MSTTKSDKPYLSQVKTIYAISSSTNGNKKARLNRDADSQENNTTSSGQCTHCEITLSYFYFFSHSKGLHTNYTVLKDTNLI